MSDDWIVLPLRVIKKPVEGTRTVLIAGTADGIVAVGDGPKVRMVCGGCRTVLAERVTVGQLQNFVIRCRCGAHNETSRA